MTYEVNVGDYHVTLFVDSEGTLVADFDRLNNEPDKAEPVRVCINDTPVFDGTE